MSTSTSTSTVTVNNNNKISDSTFDCNICCETRKLILRNKPMKVVCLNCNQIVCRDCQIAYSRDCCMNCEIKFTREFILETLGDKFLKDIVKPLKIKELMQEQEASLPQVQPLIEQERQRRNQKNEMRFGRYIPVTAGNRGNENDNSHRPRQETFRCPVDECRGFIIASYGNQCEVCKVQVCLKCRVQISSPNKDNVANKPTPVAAAAAAAAAVSDNIEQTRSAATAATAHVCLTVDLDSVNMIRTTTRPCPKCTASIFKIEGCDHMYCTHCATHFSWTTGKVLKTSTNEHYLQLDRYARNVVTRPGFDAAGVINGVGGAAGANDSSGDGDDDQIEGNDCTGEGYSLTRDAVPLIHLDYLRLTSKLTRALYDDTNVIRTLVHERLQVTEILQKARENLENLQIKYLLGELTYEQWSNKVYQVSQKREVTLLYSDVFKIYLSMIAHFQTALLRGKLVTKVEQEVEQLITLCNNSFASIKREYGGASIVLRQLSDSSETPAVVGV